MSVRMTLENSRQTTLWEFCDLGIKKPIHVVAEEWRKGYAKIMKGEKVYDEDGNELIASITIRLKHKYEIDDLEHEVNRALDKGWKIVGRAFYQGNMWYQTITKEE